MVYPSILSRIAARLYARPLDRLVEAGASPQPGSALEAHMLRLGSIGYRERLAAELRRRGAVVLCDRVMSLSPSRVNVPAVWAAADLIERVEKRLLTDHAVSPRGTHGSAACSPTGAVHWAATAAAICAANCARCWLRYKSVAPPPKRPVTGRQAPADSACRQLARPRVSPRRTPKPDADTDDRAAEADEPLRELHLVVDAHPAE